MDRGIGICNQGILQDPYIKNVHIIQHTKFVFVARKLLFDHTHDTHPALQYFAWISLPVTLVLFAAGFVSLVAPQCIGKSNI